MSRLCISTIRITAITAEQHADADGADAVPHRVAGDHRQADAGQREHQTDQRAGVLEQHHRQLGVARACG